MKTILKFICAALCLGSLHAGETVSLIATTTGIVAGYSPTITLAAGDSAELLYCTERGGGNGDGSPTIEVAAAGTTFDLPPTNQNTAAPPLSKSLTIAGPATVKLKIKSAAAGASEVSKAMATLDVRRAGTPSDPVQVPLEAGSNFNVIFENSADLVNWFPVPAGIYSGTETRRFFRIRMVKQ